MTALVRLLDALLGGLRAARLAASPPGRPALAPVWAAPMLSRPPESA